MGFIFQVMSCHNINPIKRGFEMGASLLRIMIGTAIGCVTGILLAALSWRWNSIRAFLSPFVSVLKSIPVASFVILILIWFGNRNVSLIISLLVAFPILYVNTLSGLDALDQGMLEMAYVFKIPLSWKIRRIILPECYPAMSGGFSLAIGMGMKSGVAAEVIGQARYSLGNDRVAIVRACMVQSDLLVFDEPFTGLDEVTRHKALSYIHAQQRGRTMFFTAHDADFLRKEFPNLIEIAL